MMKITFLEHSGFLVELDSHVLLFDWWKGKLPALPSKPLLVFVSHAHHDHFNPAVFQLDAAAFLLSADIVLSPQHRGKWAVSEDVASRCYRLNGNEQCVPLPGVTVETFFSTDEGVAFLVTADGLSVFHAGDLNWWHWEGEPDPWNPDMEKTFKQYAEPLRGRKIDLAMLPLDPRQEEYGFLGAEYYLNLAHIRRFVPMHQWENFAFTDAFLARYPAYAAQTYPVVQNGQVIEF